LLKINNVDVNITKVINFKSACTGVRFNTKRSLIKTHAVPNIHSKAIQLDVSNFTAVKIT